MRLSRQRLAKQRGGMTHRWAAAKNSFGEGQNNDTCDLQLCMQSPLNNYPYIYIIPKTIPLCTVCIPLTTLGLTGGANVHGCATTPRWGLGVWWHQAGSASSWHFLTIHVATNVLHTVLKRNAIGSSGVCYVLSLYYGSIFASTSTISWAHYAVLKGRVAHLLKVNPRASHPFGQLYLAIDWVWILAFWKVDHIRFGWQLKLEQNPDWQPWEAVAHLRICGFMRHAQCRAHNTIELSLAEVSEEATTKLHQIAWNPNKRELWCIRPRNAADIWQLQVWVSCPHSAAIVSYRMVLPGQTKVIQFQRRPSSVHKSSAQNEWIFRFRDISGG